MRINYNLKFSVILFWSSLLINILFTQVIIEGDEIFGTGIDGELYVAEDEIFYIDQVITQLSGSASTGQNQITISNTSGFNINDEILIVNIQDPTFYGLNCPYLDEETNLTGNHETHYIEDISGNVLILKESLKYNYNSYTQVIRIPNYSNMIIDGTLTCNAWDGSLGGNIAFSVSDTLIVNGQITVNGLGFRGGPGGYWDSNDWDLRTGKPGEGLVGYGWNQSDCSWAFHRINGGGGGITPCGSYYVGAGGGGNSTAGIGPSLNGCGPATEGGIAIFTENGEDRLLFGGAGGGGGRTTQNGTGGDGANGGGMIIFFANYLMGNGSISANGNSAVSVSSSQGGGGAGGTIRIILGDHEYNGSINASGGQGGSCTNNCANYSNGGIGGLGRVRIDMDINSSPPSSNPQNYIGILGCTDSEGYNYDSNADSDYNFCDYYYDCNGVLNGDALLDNCGSCDNDLSNDCNVVINEIMQNPSSVSDNDGEWFEIENIGTESINLNGWAVKDNGTDNHIINSDILIESGGIAVLGNNLNVSENGGVTLSYEYIDFNLGNSNDEIIIINNQGITMDSVAYDGGPDFPDPNGASMALLNSLVDNNVGANWIESNTIYGDGDMGTPGVPNFDAEILLSDSSIVMDTTWIGSISTKELTIINNGTQDLNILSVSTNSNEFNASPENGIVTIGESFPMTITFEPDYPDYSGSYSDTLTIETDDFENQIILIDLNGYGYRPVPLIDLPTSLTFQDTPEFQTSTEFVTITNPGDTTLTITSITSDTEIFQSEYTNFLVGPGSFFEIPINFIPVNNELYNGILNILSDGININFINLSINFDGIDDKIIIPNDATLDVGSGSATYEFYIKTTYNGIGNIIHSFDSAVSPAFHSGLDGGKITAWCRNSNGEWGLNSIMSIDDDNWHHIAVIKDSNNEKLIIYIDGIFDNERSI
ncbi:MAG: lamin tail domain-containing protein, partial [Candidatus Pelagibacter sp.]|nr:lamin tail domain-containing protein [Candidatus Pelagibacter sp.]